MMSVYDDLVDFKKEVSEFLTDPWILNNAIESGKDLSETEVIWTKGTYFSIIPLEAELSGVTPSRPMKKEPSNKRNCSKNFFSRRRLVKIESYNSQGLHSETEIFYSVGNKVLSRRINSHGERVWLKVAVMDGERALMSCRVDDDGEYWSYSYVWQGTKVSEITSHSSNSVPGIKLSVDYGTTDEVVAISFEGVGGKVFVYTK